MRTETIEVKIYKYNELSDEKRETIRDSYLYMSREPNEFKECVLNNLSINYGITNLDVAFNLGYSQGDGLCLHGHLGYNDIKCLGDNVWNDFTKGLDEKQIKLVKEEMSGILFYKANHRYSHSKTVMISVEMFDINEESDNEKERKNISDMVQKNVEAWYEARCEEYEEAGYKYFYELSDEEMNNICEENGYEFKEDGTLYDK